MIVACRRDVNLELARPSVTGPAPESASGAAQNSGRKRDQSPEQIKDAVDSYADQPKRQGEQPDERVKDQRQERQRPAKNKQYKPENKCHCGRQSLSDIIAAWNSDLLLRAPILCLSDLLQDEKVAGFLTTGRIRDRSIR